MQTFTGLEYLKMDIASNFGLDKLDWDQRLAWTDTNMTMLEDLLPHAETPALYFAGVQALRKTQAGEPTGYPISLDATSSGLQLLACLVGCRDSAKLCNVVSTGHREDAYTGIYKAMCDSIGDTAKIERKDVKQAVMTSLYSSTAEPKRVFGEGQLLTVFYDTMDAKPGDVPGEITLTIDTFLNPKLPWETILFNFFNAMTSEEYSFTRPNRRFHDPIVPGITGRNGLEHLI